MKQILVGAAGAFALVTVAFSSGAQAQCVWTGLNWSCAAAPPVYVQPYEGAYQPPVYQYYPGYSEGYGAYLPPWEGHYPGPRAGGH